MIKLFNKAKASAQDTAAAKSVPSTGTGKLNQLKEILPYYPIGVRVRYYPEFQENIVLDSIIIAYIINGKVFYSDTEVRWEESGGGNVITLTTEGKVKRYNSVDDFQFIIPASGGSEEKLDYFRRETLGRNSGLTRGNNITIIADQRSQRLPLIQTTVNRRTLVTEGFYANQKIVLLDVDVDSFMLADQRSSYRLSTRLPVVIKIKEDGDVIHCTLVDFAEHSVRITFSEDEPLAAFIAADKSVILNLILPEQEKSFTLKGNVYRRGKEYAVVTLDMIEKNGSFSKMDMIDSLEVKTLLLQNAITSPA